MAAMIEEPPVQTLSEVLQALGPIKANGSFDKWSGKRVQPRADVMLPIRLRPVGEVDDPRGPAFTARSRDMCEQGLGLTIPYQLNANQAYQVEIFTEMGTWVGRMRSVHCTQTIGGYKVGMQCVPDEDRRSQAEEIAADQNACADEQSSILTLEQAREEVRQATRRYQLAEMTWGMFGVQMEREIKRILDKLPPPLETRLKLEPRRDAYRYEVEGYAHLLVSTEAGQQLVTMPISDISAGGARIMLSGSPEAESVQPGTDRGSWQTGSPVALGLWTEENGTLWLPARVAHCGSEWFEEKSVGLQFIPARALQDHR